MGKKHKTFRKEEKDGQLEKLKNANRRLKSDNEQLKRENIQLQELLDKNISYLKKETKNVPIKDLIKGADKRLEQVKDDIEKCPICSKRAFKRITVTRLDGNWSFGQCSDSLCRYRTDLEKE